MPACGSEGLQGLVRSSKNGQASPLTTRQQQQQEQQQQQQEQQQEQQQQQQQQQQHNHHVHHRRRRQELQQAPVLVRKNDLKVIVKLKERQLLLAVLRQLLLGWLWLCWLCLRVPLAALGLVLGLLRGPQQAARGRCVLVSGGSTVQGVQLARNLSRAGARVVVCEVEGLFGLARFSRACDSYYTVPRTASVAGYVSALKDIVRRERVELYVPVSASPSAYFDALAKPHLEQLGCECLVPGAEGVSVLDDPLELLRRGQALGLRTPRHHLVLDRLADAARLYEAGVLRAARHLALPAGPVGLRARAQGCLKLPASLAEFEQLERRLAEEPGRWLVLRDPGGPHFVTCTLLRDSRVLANVTCRVLDEESRGGGSSLLLPEERPEVERWLGRFFSPRGSLEPRLSGYLCFRLAASRDHPDELVAISCRVGVGTAYLSSEPEDARLLWDCHGSPARTRPCRHRRRAADKRGALLLYWDPLPYCVYCLLQLPFRRIVELLGAQQTQHKPPLALVK